MKTTGTIQAIWECDMDELGRKKMEVDVKDFKWEYELGQFGVFLLSLHNHDPKNRIFKEIRAAMEIIDEEEK